MQDHREQGKEHVRMATVKPLASAPPEYWEHLWREEDKDQRGLP
jgi:hypothetical protein